MDANKRILPTQGRPDHGSEPAPARRDEFFSSNNKVSAKLGDGMLENNHMTKPRSIWDVLVSFAAHAGIVLALILVPLLYTNALDLPQYQKVFLAAPPPLPPPPAPAAAPRAPKVPKKQFFKESKLYTPKEVPKAVPQVQEQASAAPPEEAPGVVGGVPGGVQGGAVGGVLGGVGNGPAAPPKPEAPKGPVRVGGNVRRPELVHKVEPTYPPLARQTRVQGDVIIDCVIDEQGNVTQARAVSGHPLLVQSALQAVKQWKFQPTMLNGKPVAVEMTVTVQFNMGAH